MSKKSQITWIEGKVVSGEDDKVDNSNKSVASNDVKIETVDVSKENDSNTVSSGNTKNGYQRFVEEAREKGIVGDIFLADGNKGKNYSYGKYNITEEYDKNNNLLGVTIYDNVIKSKTYLDSNYVNINDKITYFSKGYQHDFGNCESDYILNVDKSLEVGEKTKNKIGDKIEYYKNQFYEEKVVKDKEGNTVDTQILDLTTNKKYYYNKSYQLYRVDTFDVAPGANITYNEGVSAVYSNSNKDGYLLINHSEVYDYSNKIVTMYNGNYNKDNEEKNKIIKKDYSGIAYLNPKDYITFVEKNIDKEKCYYIETIDYKVYRNNKYEIKKIKDKDGKIVETQILDTNAKKKYYYNNDNKCYRYDTYELVDGQEIKYDLNKSADGSYLQLHDTYLYNDETKKFDGYNNNKSLYNLTNSDIYLSKLKDINELFSNDKNIEWLTDSNNNIAIYQNDNYRYVRHTDSNKFEIFDLKNNTTYYYDHRLYRTENNNNICYINEKGEIYRIENKNNDNYYIEFDNTGATEHYGKEVKAEEKYSYDFGRDDNNENYLVLYKTNITKKYYKDKIEIFQYKLNPKNNKKEVVTKETITRDDKKITYKVDKNVTSEFLTNTTNNNISGEYTEGSDIYDYYNSQFIDIP